MLDFEACATFDALHSIPRASVLRTTAEKPILAIVERDGCRAILSIRPDHLALVTIKTRLEARGRRAASRLLRDITAVADLHAVPMTLLVSPSAAHDEPHLGRTELHAWYSRLGFVRVNVSSFCYRAPRAIAAAA